MNFRRYIFFHQIQIFYDFSFVSFTPFLLFAMRRFPRILTAHNENVCTAKQVGGLECFLKLIKVHKVEGKFEKFKRSNFE